MLTYPRIVGISAVLKQVSDDFVARFSGHGIRILEETCCEDDKEDLEDWVVFDDLVLSKALGPEKIAFAEDTTP